MASGETSEKRGHYKGKYCSGSGDTEYLRLIDESFAFFHPNPVVPNLTMIYKPEWDTFTEGAGWGAWWVQNSYGFSYSATPFLEEPWVSILQRSWDLFWDNQGDGKRKSLWGDGKPNKLSELVAPDGSLGDAAAPGKIIFKQGDGNMKLHDWFYEATAAVLVMQAEILLTGHDKKAVEHYLPKMERACDCIERTRDPKNKLFLVGPACNLLAPSYGGVKLADGTFGKGYLTGLTVTYLAALDRMVEIYKFMGDNEKLAEYRRRQKITRESLPLLTTPSGYLVKSIEPDGTLHGVLGQDHYGYLEGVANADAVALRVADNKLSESIYKQIAAFPEIRPFDFLLTNAPGLDDTYGNWGSATGPGIKGIWDFGCWVNGGVWGTVEGRAILMYYRLGKFEDVRRSAIRAMKWAKDFRMDAPWSQCGENTNNIWSDNGKFREGGVAVMVDNFAIPAATIRGLFDYEYQANGIILRPRVPGSITQYTQKQPIHFGTKKIYISCRNGGTRVTSVKVNGKSMTFTSSGEIFLNYESLPANAKVEIVTKGAWAEEPHTSGYPELPTLVQPKETQVAPLAELPDTLKKPFAILSATNKLLANEPDAAFEREYLAVALKSFEDYRVRATMDAGPGYYRSITPDRKEGIIKFYEKAALTMYTGFTNRMSRYAEKGDVRQNKIAEMFLKSQAQQKTTDAERLSWWHEAKFGMFIHWGVYAMYGGVYKGHQQARGDAAWIENRCKIPVAEYRENARQFNPVNYDPDAWAKMAKDAGMKYLIITAKHHDGFALFSSKASDWNVVTATQYGKDLLKPLAEACKKYGIKLGFYYSQAVDWTNPGASAARRLMKEGWPNPDSTRIDQYTKEHGGCWDPIQTSSTFDQYIDQVAVPQVKELLTNYGDVSILWWDYATQMKTVEGSEKLKKVLDIQPNIITNDRLHPDFHGDTQSPEQAIPDRDAVDGQNWETCMTMSSSWGYKKNDSGWKSSETLIRNLVKIAARGGNYLLNIGPKPDGSFPEESIQRLKDIGQWMKVNGEAIYGTQASPLDLLPWGECTKKQTKNNTVLYLSVFDWPKDGQLTVPGIRNKVVSAQLLATGAKLKTNLMPDNLNINIPATAPDKNVSVIRLEVKGRVERKITMSPKKKMQSGAVD